jgi:hypothetical protein
MRLCYTLLLGILEAGVQGAQVSSVSLASIGGAGFPIHWRAHNLPLLLPRAFDPDEFVIDRVGWTFPSSRNELDDVRKLVGVMRLMCLTDYRYTKGRR